MPQHPYKGNGQYPYKGVHHYPYMGIKSRKLKRALHNHNGLNEANKKKFIDGFINTKK